MKQIFSAIILTLMLTACGTMFKSAEDKAAYEAGITQQVVENLENRHYVIDVTYMRPRGSMLPPRRVTNFSLEVKGDTVVSYLPYFGEVWGSAYNYGGPSGLNFTGIIREYIEQSAGRDLERIQFVTDSKEDRYLFMLDIFSNGKTTISVIGENRQSIDFDGDMRLKY